MLSQQQQGQHIAREKRKREERNYSMLSETWVWWVGVTWQGPVLNKTVDYSRPHSLPCTKAPHPSHRIEFYPVGLSGPRWMIPLALMDLTRFSHLFRALLHSKKHSRRSCLFWFSLLSSSLESTLWVYFPCSTRVFSSVWLNVHLSDSYFSIFRLPDLYNQNYH